MPVCCSSGPLSLPRVSVLCDAVRVTSYCLASVLKRHCVAGLCSIGQAISGVWPDNFLTEHQHDNAEHINYKELWVVLRCVSDQRLLLRGWRVLFRVDNTAAEHYVNIRYGRIQSLESLAALLDETKRQAMCWCLAVH